MLLQISLLLFLSSPSLVLTYPAGNIEHLFENKSTRAEVKEIALKDFQDNVSEKFMRKI